MFRKVMVLMIAMSILCGVTSCSRDKTGRQQDGQPERQSVVQPVVVAQGQDVPTNQFYSDRFKVDSTLHDEVSLRREIYSARSVRSVRPIVDKKIDEILSMPESTNRMEQMLLLASVVNDWPIDMRTSSSRANSYHLRYKMGLEVFDGLLKLGGQKEAWQFLLKSIREYRQVRDKSRDELDQHQAHNGGGIRNRNEARAKAAALEYYHLVDNDYKCAVQAIYEIILPNAKYKFGITPDVEAKFRSELTEP